jgi:signal transduction histidine kinase
MEKILIVEDSPTQRQMLQHTLEQEGYAVVAAVNGRDALAQVDAAAPDLVITDLVMPEMDGYALCRALKSGRREKLPVIILTALCDPKDIIAGLASGADNFIGKPFEAEYLLSRVRTIFSNQAIANREKSDGGVEVVLEGQSYIIHSERRQIVDLLLSVYDAAIRRNRDLIAAQEKLTRLNDELERKFQDRELLLASERSARSDAERANRLKEEFLATVSHELRTPLNAILGWAQLLLETSGPEAAPELLEGLGSIERNVRTQTQIVDDLLDMSRIISGKLRLTLRPFQMPEVIKAGMETVQSAAAAKGVRLTVAFIPGLPSLTGDPNRLQQVVWNLLNNAVKFTPSGGRVHLSVELLTEQVIVSVTDTGSGIEAAFLPHVFDRFRQSDSSITRRHGGLGLGLSIVKQLVELHGGSVAARSPGLGHGSTFLFTLPIVVTPPPAAPTDSHAPLPRPEKRPAASDRRLDGVYVLAVDDEPDVRVLVKRLLEERGALVRTASTSAEAIQHLGAERFDVLLSDIGLPDEDGVSLIRRVRASIARPGRPIPALALTAYTRHGDRERALAAGFQDYLTKPVDTNDLVNAVANLAHPDSQVPTPRN